MWRHRPCDAVKAMLAAIAIAAPVATACGDTATTHDDASAGVSDAMADGAAGSGDDASAGDATAGGAGSDAWTDAPDASADGSDSGPVETCGGPCTTTGRCLVRLAAGQSDTHRITVDSTSLYWDTSDTMVMRMPLAGGVPTALVYGGLGAVDAVNLYYTVGGDVKSMPLAGGLATTLAVDLAGPAQILVDSDDAYVLVGSAGVLRIPFDGGPTSTVSYPASYAAFRMALDATNLYVTAYDALDNVSGNDRIIQIPLDGGTPTTLASTPRQQGDGPYEIYDIAVGATNVYWLDPGVVRSVPIGGGAVTAVATGLAGPMRLAVDDQAVYWTDAADGTVNKAPLDGGPRTVLARCQQWPTSIAVDGTSVYWTNETTAAGTVMKVTPK